MSFVEALQFPFQDKNWITKFVITIVLLFIPILGWFVFSGYSIRLIRNLQNGINELPEYDDFGGDFSRGFMVFLGSLVYYIPSLLISCCSQIIGQGDNGGLNAIGCLLTLVQWGYTIIVTPLLMSALARYAINEQINVFFDFAGRIEDVTSHINDVVVLYVNLILLYIVSGIGIGIGLVLCCIPGLIMIVAYVMAYVYLVAQWGKVIGVGGTETAGTMSTI